jgi:hypothetical protein
VKSIRQYLRGDLFDYDDEGWEFAASSQPGRPRARDIIEVGMNKARMGDGIKSLVSNQFYDCIAVLLKHPESGKTGLLHINKATLTSKQIEFLQNFNQLAGQKIALIIWSAPGEKYLSSTEEKMCEQIPQLQCQSLRVYADQWWNMAYRPGNDELLIDSLLEQQIIVYRPFSELTPIQGRWTAQEDINNTGKSGAGATRESP